MEEKSYEKLNIKKKRWKFKIVLLFLLFLVYFPQIVEGPIANYSRLSKTLFNTEKFNYDNFVSSFVLIGWGFIKKLVIADRAGIFVSKVFENNYGGILLIVGIFLYTLQIYAYLIITMTEKRILTTLLVII